MATWISVLVILKRIRKLKCCVQKYQMCNVCDLAILPIEGEVIDNLLQLEGKQSPRARRFLKAELFRETSQEFFRNVAEQKF